MRHGGELDCKRLETVLEAIKKGFLSDCSHFRIEAANKAIEAANAVVPLRNESQLAADHQARMRQFLACQKALEEIAKPDAHEEEL